MDATLRPQAYQEVMRTGLPFHQELNLKPGSYMLQLSVLDSRKSEDRHRGCAAHRGGSGEHGDNGVKLGLGTKGFTHPLVL
jgi:hypothetical protein